MKKIKIKNILKRLFFFVFFLCLVFILFILYQTRDEISATPENIKSRLTSYHDQNEMAGFAVSVFSKDSLYYVDAFGYADVKNNIPYATTTIQHIASISKTTIGVALLKAEELGLLNLNDPINDHLPFKVIHPKFPDRNILVRHLASHGASLRYNEKVVESLYVQPGESSPFLHQFFQDYFVNGKYGAVTFTEFEPGTHWEYSNIGSGLAAYLIEHLSKLSFAQFSKRYIFQPLQMNSTDWFEKDTLNLQYAKYYEPDEEGRLSEVNGNGVLLYPCRDLMTNAEDLTNYAQAIMAEDDAVLTSISYHKMLSPLHPRPINMDVDDTGMFWMRDRNNYGIPYSMIGMNGGDHNINSMMWFDPKTELGYIFIGNTGRSEQSFGNHIWIYRSLVSLGDHIVMNDPDHNFLDKIKFKWHNVYSRVNGLF